MARSFSLVDSKVTEADFFLKKMAECGYNLYEMRFYLSAFISAARTITFSLQSVLSKTNGFDEWYLTHQNSLKEDAVARFFHNFRRFNQHTGENLANAGAGGPDQETLYWFVPTPDISKVPSKDVLTASRQYFTQILEIVFDCYLQFGPEIDEQQRYTSNYFSKIDKTIEDAEEELGFPRGWTDIGNPNFIEHRWQALRDSATGCEINDIFYAYLNKHTPIPDRPSS